MLDVAKMKQVFIDANLFFKETSKNFIIKCPYCGDKKSRNGHHHAHCYVSTNENNPVAHCFYCNGSWPITKLLFDITGKTSSEIIQVSQNYGYRTTRVIREDSIKTKKYNLPENLEIDKFGLKAKYMNLRTFNLIDIEKIPNLIFNVNEFFSINGIKPNIDLGLSKWETELLQHNFVVFLSKHHTMLYCRNIVKETKIPFRKIPLQKSNFEHLDYYEIDLKHENSDTVVLSEGNFDILGCYAYNSLKLNNKANVYASGCTFSYGELLKSVCFDRSIYRANVYVLSDNDKKEYHYRNFIKNAVTAKTINIIYNRYGKDFGMIKQSPTKVF